MFFHSFSLRERLRKANGDADNQVMLVQAADAPGGFSTTNPVLTDACWSPTNQKIVEKQVNGIGTTKCNTYYPVWPSPRQVAGASVANDIIKCRLRPLTRSDYKVKLTSAQWKALRQTFRGGVCDWSAQGVGQQRPAGSWPTFP